MPPNSSRAVLFATVLAGACASSADGEVPRTADGKPDLSGYYDAGTTTPLARRGTAATVSATGAAFIAKQIATGLAAGSARLDPRREAPPAGGEANRPGATAAFFHRLPEEDWLLSRAGDVGGYDSVWLDMGRSHTKVRGEYRMSIIVDPPDGRLPPLTPQAHERVVRRGYAKGTDDGTAWWLPGPGPFDDPELRPLADRCLVGLSSTGGPPMLPSFYNNHKRIVQTPRHVMILTEMVHDARVVRIGGQHVAADIRRWFGDSIGWWDGDTLVVETTNFNDTPALGFGATADLRVVERFTPMDERSLLYRFTVQDPATWERPWTGEYAWTRTDKPVYEYACHEGNYSMGNVLCGARRLEAEALGGEALAAFAHTPCGARVGASGAAAGR